MYQVVMFIWLTLNWERSIPSKLLMILGLLSYWYWVTGYSRYISSSPDNY